MNKTKKDSIMNSIRDWKIIKLGRVCEFKRGFSYTSAQITNKQTGIKFVTINNLEKEGGMKKNGKDFKLLLVMLYCHFSITFTLHIFKEHFYKILYFSAL